MPTLLVTLIAAATLAFGAVYPWAYMPLFAAAGLIGLAGIWHGGIRPELRPVAVAFLVLWTAVAFQLVPLPRALAAALSPATPALASRYTLAVADPATAWLPLSVAPGATRTALFALAALSLYVLGLPALLNGDRVRALPRALAAFALPLALFAIYTRQHNNGLIYGFWASVDGGGADQAGPFINRNHFAGWMLMALCLMIGWMVGSFERAFARRGSRRTGFGTAAEDAGGMLPMTVVIVFGAISLFWTISRSAILSFGVAICLFAWCVLTRGTLGKGHRRFALGGFSVVLLVAVAWRGPDILVRWFLDESSLLSRLDAWRDAWDVIRQFPVAGTGLNTFSAAMLFYQTRNPGFHMAQAHNDYLQLLAEGGLVVTIPAAAALLLLALAIRSTLRAARHEARGYWVRAGAAIALVAVGLQEVVEFSLQMPANTLLFATLAAVGLTPVRGAVANPGPRANIPSGKESARVALP